jgi:hypothetical protein
MRLYYILEPRRDDDYVYLTHSDTFCTENKDIVVTSLIPVGIPIKFLGHLGGVVVIVSAIVGSSLARVQDF